MQIKPFRRSPHFYETDQMGIVHHSNYIRWFEEARVDLMDQLGYSYQKTRELGIDIAVIDVDCRYRSMVRFGDDLCIYLSVAELSPVRMRMSYRVEDAHTGDLRTTGSSGHCFVGRDDHKLLRLDHSNPELLERLTALHKSME